MTWMRTVIREIFGLFVDDGSFALLILAWLPVCLFLLPHLGSSPAWTSVILFAGLALILVGSAIRYKRPGGH